MLIVGAFALALFVLPSPWGAVAIALAIVGEVAETYFWIRFLRRYRVRTGAEGLVGERAEVIAACNPEGRVRLRGELWRARSDRPLATGEKVTVTGVDGLTLEVAPDR